MPGPLVVGGGIAGIACAAALADAGLPVLLRERDPHLGGRLASVSLQGTGTALDGRAVDVGASYLTAREPAFRAVVDDLVGCGVLRPWTDTFHVADPDGLTGVATGPMRYAAPDGLGSVVPALGEHVPGLTLRLSSPVTHVRADGRAIVVDDAPSGPVALCVPAPVAAALCPDVPTDAVAWEPVVTVILVFGARTWPELDGVFVNQDAAVTWIADDGRRRGDGAPVLVASTHPVLSARHLEAPAAVVPAVVAAVRRVLGIDAMPDWVDAIGWRFAKPTAARPDLCWLATGVPLGQAGDTWADGPRVESAWLSGRALGAALAAHVTRGAG